EIVARGIAADLLGRGDLPARVEPVAQHRRLARLRPRPRLVTVPDPRPRPDPLVHPQKRVEAHDPSPRPRRPRRRGLANESDIHRGALTATAMDWAAGSPEASTRNRPGDAHEASGPGRRSR